MSKTNSTDANIFIFARYMAFIGSTVISALLNVLFFMNLEVNYARYFLIASLALEFCKVTTILTYNAFGAIYRKFPIPKIRKKQYFWFVWYIVFAALAILASVNFSLMVTSKSDTAYLNSKSQYEIQISDIEKKQEEFSLYESSLPTLRQQAEIRLQQAEVRRDEFEASYLPWSVENYGANGWNDYVTARDRRAEERNRLTEEQERYNRDLQSFDTKLTTLQDDLRVLEATYGRIPDIRIKLAELEKDRNANAGANLGFILLAQTLHLPEQQLKLLILLFISILIEMVVFTTAPDIHITRRFLYYFRNSFPNNVSLDKILIAFDKENIKFSDLDRRIEKLEDEEIGEKKEKLSITSIPLPETIKEEFVERPMEPPRPNKPQEVVFSNGETRTYPGPILDANRTINNFKKTIEEEVDKIIEEKEIKEVMSEPNAINGKGKFIIRSAEAEIAQMVKKPTVRSKHIEGQF